MNVGDIDKGEGVSGGWGWFVLKRFVFTTMLTGSISHVVSYSKLR